MTHSGEKYLFVKAKIEHLNHTEIVWWSGHLAAGGALFQTLQISLSELEKAYNDHTS